MTEVYLLKDGEFAFNTSWEKLTLLFTSPETLNWDEDTLIKYNGKYYYWCCCTTDNTKIAVRPHTHPVDVDCEDDERLYESDIICPYCGYHELNSYEYAASNDDTYTCSRCGAQMTLEIEHTISYTTKLTKPGNVLEVE